MPGLGIQCNQPYLSVIWGGTRHNHSTKEYNSVLYSISSQICLHSFWLLVSRTPWSRTICVLKLLPLTFILSINMTVNDHLMEILLQFRKCHLSLFALGSDYFLKSCFILPQAPLFYLLCNEFDSQLSEPLQHLRIDFGVFHHGDKLPGLYYYSDPQEGPSCWSQAFACLKLFPKINRVRSMVLKEGVREILQ